MTIAMTNTLDQLGAALCGCHYPVISWKDDKYDQIKKSSIIELTSEQWKSLSSDEKINSLKDGLKHWYSPNHSEPLYERAVLYLEHKSSLQGDNVTICEKIVQAAQLLGLLSK